MTKADHLSGVAIGAAARPSHFLDPKIATRRLPHFVLFRYFALVTWSCIAAYFLLSSSNRKTRLLAYTLETFPDMDHVALIIILQCCLYLSAVLVVRYLRSAWTYGVAHACVLLAELFLPHGFTRVVQTSVSASSGSCLTITLFMAIIAMKTHSLLCTYFPRMQERRPKEKEQQTKKPKGESVCSAEELPRPSFSSAFYFLAAPTLNYLPAYPRSPQVEVGLLARDVACAVGGLVVLHLLYFELMLPLMRRTCDMPLLPFMALSLGPVYVWISVAFLTLWHFILNIFANVTRFADRHFYGDWWTVPTMRRLFRVWSRPVYSWIVLHLYRPALNTAGRRWLAVGWALGISAVAHEFVYATYLRIVTPYTITMVFMAIGMYLDNYFEGRALWQLYVITCIPTGFCFNMWVYMRWYAWMNSNFCELQGMGSLAPPQLLHPGLF